MGHARRHVALVLSGALTAGFFVVVPVLGTSAATPEPVAPSTTEVALVVDPAAQVQPDPQARSMTPFSTQAAPVTLVASSEASGFTVAGVVWDGSSRASVSSVEIRSREGSAWSEWEPVPIEESEKDPEPGTAPGPLGTEPIVVGEVDEVEVRLVADSVPDGAKLSVVDPGTSDADAVGTQPASAAFASSTPVIHPRSSWGADESLMQWTPRQAQVTGAVIHHTAGTNDYSAEQVPSILRGIYAYHAQTRGWGDIGYNFLVDKFGRVWEGRAGGVTMATAGAHTVNYNSAMTGISVMGDYTSTGISSPAWDAVADLTAWKLSIHGVRANDTATVNGGRYPAIVGHRDVGSTACPGQQIYGRLGELRNYVGMLQGRYTDVFATALGNFVTVAGNSTVYLVANGTRHPVKDWSTLTAYSNLGGISVASSSYVSSLALGRPLERFARNATTGDIYFVDSNIRLRAPSCTIVGDYGAACDSAVNLTPAQLGRLSNGPQLTKGYVTTNGKLFYVDRGSRREAFDGASVAAAGITTQYVRLTESGIAHLPYGDPIFRPDVVVRDRATRAAYLYTDSRLLPTAASVVEQTALRNRPQASFDGPSLARVTKSGSLQGYAKPATGPARYLVTDSGLLDVAGMTGFADSQFTTLNAALLGSMPVVSRSKPVFVRSAGSTRLYMLQAPDFRPVLALQDWIDLAGTQNPTALRFADAAAPQFRVGPDIPSPGSLIKSPSSPQVYVADGFSRRVPLEVFDVQRALGLPGAVRTLPAATISRLTLAGAPLSPFISCNGWSMVGLKGVVHPHTLGSAAGSGLPVTTLTAQTCGRLPIAWNAVSGPVFVQSTGDTKIYRVVSGQKKHIGSWAELTRLAGTSSPTIYPLGPSALAGIPTVR